MHIILSTKTTYNDNFIWISDFNVRSCFVITKRLYAHYIIYINVYYSRKCMCLTNLCQIFIVSVFACKINTVTFYTVVLVCRYYCKLNYTSCLRKYYMIYLFIFICIIHIIMVYIYINYTNNKQNILTVIVQ